MLHTLDAPVDQSIAWFQLPRADVSAHYVVDSDGYITELVEPEDVSYTTGNEQYNQTSINIKLAGYADLTPFSDALYRTAGLLSARLCDAYEIPIRHPTSALAPCRATESDGGIIAHSQIPSPANCARVVDGKDDPGALWDWDRFMSLVADPPGAFQSGASVVTSANATVREAPEIGQNVVFTQPTGKPGTVTDGPTQNDGFVWWRVEYDNGISGWSAQRTLDRTLFAADEVVVTRSETEVRTAPRTSAELVTRKPEATLGTVVSRPVSIDDTTWWQLRYEDGTEGWSAQRRLGRPAFPPDDRVGTAESVPIRSRPGRESAPVTTAPEGWNGYVRDGPVQVGTDTWWEIAYNAGDRGWTPGRRLHPAPLL